MSAPGSARHEVSRLPRPSQAARPAPGGDGPRHPRAGRAGRAGQPSQWCIFYGGDDAAAQAAVPVLATPMLAELSDEDRPAQCWPRSAAEFAAALSD